MLNKITSFFIAFALACIAATIIFLPFGLVISGISDPLNLMLGVVGIGVALPSGVHFFQKLYPFFKK